MTDDVMHATQYLYQVLYINRAIFANLQHRPFKLSRLIVLLDHAYKAQLANINMERQRWPEKPLLRLSITCEL